MVLDGSRTEALTIYSQALELPKGVVSVDKGETAQTVEPGHFPRCQPYLYLAVPLGTQILKLGTGPTTSPLCDHDSGD